MADGDTTFDTRVTPSFMSANIRGLPEYSEETAGLFSHVIQAFDQAYGVVAAVYEAKDKAAHDATLNEAGRMLAVADFSDKMQEKATKAFDYANNHLTTNITALEKALSEPVQSQAANSSLSREIRDHVRGLKAKGSSAMSFVTSCINSGDFASASAVLGAVYRG